MKPWFWFNLSFGLDPLKHGKMVNGLHLYSAFIQSVVHLYSAFIQSTVHLYSAFIQSAVHLYSAFIQSAVRLYSAFIQSAVQFMPHSPVHTHIHTHIHTPMAIGCHARYQPARQEQSGVRCLAQGHFDTPRVGSNRQPSDCQMTALTSWAISGVQKLCSTLYVKVP